MQRPFRQVLASIREASSTEKDKGTRFERLVKRWLETDPVYRSRFSQVWMWMDWPYRDGKADLGVDLVTYGPEFHRLAFSRAVSKNIKEGREYGL